MDTATPLMPPLHCPSCDRYGTVDDAIEPGGPCQYADDPDEPCDGIIEWTYQRDRVLAETKPRIAAIRGSDADRALADEFFWNDEGPGFSCGEAEAIGAMMYHLGVDLDTIAELIVDGHGRPGPDSGECPGGAHYHEEATDEVSTDR